MSLSSSIQSKAIIGAALVLAIALFISAAKPAQAQQPASGSSAAISQSWHGGGHSGHGSGGHNW